MLRLVALLLCLILVSSTARAERARSAGGPGVATLAAASDRSNAPGAGRAEVQAFVKGYLDAANRADVTAMMEMVSRRTDVSSITDGFITRGWEAIRQDNDQFAGKEGAFRFSLGTIDVTPLGSGYALAVAPVVVTVVAGEDTLQADSALTLVLEKTGGKWRILHEHMSGQEPEQDQDLGPGDDDSDPGIEEGE